jgi:hypothetical protein
MTLLRHRPNCQRLNRRAFLRVGSAGLLGLSLADLLRSESLARPGDQDRGRATGVILIWLGGGPSTIDMWDMKPDAPPEIRGAFRLIATRVGGLQVCEHLPHLAQVMDRVTLVRSLHHAVNDHLVGTSYVMTGNRPSASTDFPSLGSLAARMLPAKPGVPPYLRLGTGVFSDRPGFLGAAYGPFVVAGGAAGLGGRLEGLSLPEEFSLAELEDRERLRQALERSFRRLDRTEIPSRLNRFQQQALDILRSDRVAGALELDQEPKESRRRYGPTPLGRGALAARRLIEAGVRFVTLALGGVWDTHSKCFPALKDNLLPELDQALSALIGDLDERGLLRQTVVYCVGEFGRTPRINDSVGRDHWPQSMAAILAGGGFKAGYVHGRTDRFGREPDTDPCIPEDVSATIFDRLGIGPETKLPLPSGREVPLFPGGAPISQLCG